MATITLKNMPDKLYQRLKEAARERGRSVDEEMISRLQADFMQMERASPDEWLRRLRAIQKNIPSTPFDVEELEEAIDEGRP